MNYHGLKVFASLSAYLGSGTPFGIPGVKISYSPIAGGTMANAKIVLAAVAMAVHALAQRP